MNVSNIAFATSKNNTASNELNTVITDQKPRPPKVVERICNVVSTQSPKPTPKTYPPKTTPENLVPETEFLSQTAFKAL